MKRVLAIALVALVVVASAAATNERTKLVRVVKRQGSVTATLTYRKSGSGVLFRVFRPTVSVRRNGQLMLRRTFCAPAQLSPPCVWSNPASLTFSRVTGSEPSVVLDLNTGGNSCGLEKVVALLGHRPRWAVHLFTTGGASGMRIRGCHYFVSEDGRFADQFTNPPGNAYPIQVWTLDRAGKFQDATRTLARLVRKDARRWHGYLRPYHHQAPYGVLAAWCADQYLLSRGSRCAHMLSYDLAHGYLKGIEGNYGRGRAVIRELNQDLHRWGYKL
jgi:hypothetical protein